MEAIKTMINDQDILMHLWVESTRATIYVQHIISHSALGFKTSEEIFTGKKPEVSHLKIFGYPVFVHIRKEKKPIWILLGRKEYLLGTVRSPRHS